MTRVDLTVPSGLPVCVWWTVDYSDATGGHIGLCMPDLKRTNCYSFNIYGKTPSNKGALYISSVIRRRSAASILVISVGTPSKQKQPLYFPSIFSLLQSILLLRVEGYIRCCFRNRESIMHLAVSQFERVSYNWRKQNDKNFMKLGESVAKAELSILWECCIEVWFCAPNDLFLASHELLQFRTFWQFSTHCPHN